MAFIFIQNTQKNSFSFRFDNQKTNRDLSIETRVLIESC